MNDEILNEQVSALADDELGRGERQLLLRRMAENPALRDRWARYFLIRDALRDGLPGSISTDFARAVTARIAEDPQGDPAAARRYAPVMRRVAGLAVAASVAAVALVSLQVEDTAPGPVSETATVVPVTNSPQVPPVRFAATTAPSWDSARPEVQVQLNQLLLTHSDAAEATVVEPVEDDG